MRSPFPLAGLAIVFAALPAFAGDAVSYNRDIRPILSDNCFQCHGPDKESRDSGLRLDIRDEATKPAESGDTAIVPSQPEASQLLVRIFSEDRDDMMPPPKAHKTLTGAQKTLIKQWIAEGAKYEPHWAYAPLTRPQVPAVAGSALVRNPIDAFVQQRLAQEKLQPAPEADRRSLIRRLSLDIVGLPPGRKDVEAFAADQDPAAYEKLLTRLLASPQYGERMAQQWLDLARYADTVGFHGDQNQNVWAFRDWVIAAYNNNKPFDQFTIEQLAGDLLPNPTPDQLIATCFNRLNMVTREGGAQPKEYLAKYTGDRIRTVGTAWLGSTVGCAECHDHKFDPWSQKDVYSIGAFFADVKQWGVYSDYKFTPNEDLKDFTNDHPFPPEIVVESEPLKRRMENARARMIAAGTNAAPDPARLAEWQGAIRTFVEKNPSGWETPKPKVTVKSAKAEFTQSDDGRVVVEVNPAREVQLDLQPSGPSLAALKLELLPDPKHGNSIVRGAASELKKPVFELVKKGGQPTAIEIRHAQADRKNPNYRDGAEVVGVQDGWRLEGGELDEPHVAVFFPATPIALELGDVIRIRLPENLLSSVRVRTSPLSPPDPRTPTFPPDLLALVSAPGTAPDWYLRATGWQPDAFARMKEAEAEYLACRGGRTPVLVTEASKTPLTIRVLPRGNWQDESGEVVAPQTPHFLPKLPGAEGRGLNRLDLAKWIVAPENPLTARVAMNRLWRQFFGTALSAQTDDLGAQGEAPTHPELLDWLAIEFRESGWNWKHMVQLIATSHTYRQIAGLRPELRERDPQNRLLASQNPRRLDAEFVRDNALAIAGLLNLEAGGPPSYPYQPDDYYADLQFPTRQYVSDTGPRQWRRGVYTWWQRTFVHPMLLNFDAPSREDCTAMRTNANTPQQALTLLNDPTFVEAARAWAGRLLDAAPDDKQRLRLAFEQALARAPRPAEEASLLAAIENARAEFRTRPEDAPKLLKVGLAPAAKLDPVELAAWTTACRILLNLHETITRY